MHGLRVGVGGIYHETNTFSSVATTFDDFRSYQFAEGAELIRAYGGVRNEIGGFLDGATAFGLQVHPSLFAAAVPSGMVASEAFAELRDRLVAGLPTHLDAVLLCLHGAMVVDGIEDAETDIVRAAKRRCPSARVVVTLDFHANVASELVGEVDALVGYLTYPHVDPFERARRAVRIAAWTLATGRPPVTAFRKVPLVTVPQAQETAAGPMAALVRRAAELERRRDVLAVTVSAGFPYADVTRLGLAVTVHTTSDDADADAVADELVESAWAQRDDFHVANTPVEQAVDHVLAAPRGPVVLVDVADNIGGGAPGDGTVLLEALVRRGVAGSVVTVVDPAAVAAASTAGEGAVVRLPVGGRRDGFHGGPVRLDAVVRRLGDGTYVHKGSYMTGQTADMGRTAVLDADGIEVVVMERPTMPFDAEQLRSVGIEPATRRALVVKSAIAWRAAYGDMAADVVYVDTPGICTTRLDRLPYRRAAAALFASER